MTQSIYRFSFQPLHLNTYWSFPTIYYMLLKMICSKKSVGARRILNLLHFNAISVKLFNRLRYFHFVSYRLSMATLWNTKKRIISEVELLVMMHSVYTYMGNYLQYHSSNDNRTLSSRMG